MVDFPNGKINLGLFVTDKRNDGYHNLQSIFYPVNISDALEIVIHPGNGKVHLKSFGLPIKGNLEDNLIYKAILKFGKKEFDYRVNILKNIPMGGGLGGGSSNATYTLKILQQLNALRPNINLFDAAMQLGSDCGFFVENKPALVQGRGEVVTPIPLNLNGYFLKLVFPNIHISTQQTFSKIVPKMQKLDAQGLIKLPVNEWKSLLANDFEKSVFAVHKNLASVKDQLYQSGALFALMSGTGSTFYGIYNKNCAKVKATDFEEINLPL